MEIFSNGLILQMLRMMYLAASTDSSSNCWLIDVNCKGFENHEMKKAAINAFKRNEETISTYLYAGMDELGSMLMDDPSEETKLIKAAADHRAWNEAGRGFVDPRKYIYLDKALIQFARENNCSYDDAYILAKTGKRLF